MDRTSALYYQSASFLLTHPDFSSVNVTIFLHIQQPLLHISAPTLSFLCRVYTLLGKNTSLSRLLTTRKGKHHPGPYQKEKPICHSIGSGSWNPNHELPSWVQQMSREGVQTLSTSIKMVSCGEVFEEANPFSVSHPRVVQQFSKQSAIYLDHKSHHAHFTTRGKTKQKKNKKPFHTTLPAVTYC